MKIKKGIDKGKRSKTQLRKASQKDKHLQSFVEISPVKKEVLPSRKLPDCAYEY